MNVIKMETDERATGMKEKEKENENGQNTQLSHSLF